ncbi:hypothetical protein KQR57_12805 [Bacillus inaquosorum]|nr:hypothetical protein [Bacillus inaquosorum]
MEEYGGPFETLKAVILTHHDVDQVPKMLSDAGHEIKIYANWSGRLILKGIRVILRRGLSGHINLWSVRKACFSLQALLQYDTLETVICYHGGVFKGSRISG